MIGFFQFETILGIFRHIMASRKIVPPRIFRIVPFGDFHICFNLNSTETTDSLLAYQCNAIITNSSYRVLTLSSVISVKFTIKFCWLSLISLSPHHMARHHQTDLKHHHLTLPEAADLAQNRPLWKMMSTYGAMQSWVACQKRRRRLSLIAVLLSLHMWIRDYAWHWINLCCSCRKVISAANMMTETVTFNFFTRSC